MLTKLQIFLAKNKHIIVKLFTVVHLLFVGLTFAGPILYLYGGEGVRSSFIKVGEKLGSLAFVFYTVTLIPGILGRFKIFPILKAVLTLFRRQIGVSAFLTAIAHEAYIYTLPIILSGGDLLKFATSHEVYGLVAMILLFPMWLTSNNFSERKLGRYWKLLHRITYIALIAIFFHIATSKSDILSYVAFVMIILELTSWIYFAFTTKKTNPPAPTAPLQTPSPQSKPIVTGTSTTL